jgi:hypothetical protein
MSDCTSYSWYLTGDLVTQSASSPWSSTTCTHARTERLHTLTPSQRTPTPALANGHPGGAPCPVAPDGMLVRL